MGVVKVDLEDKSLAPFLVRSSRLVIDFKTRDLSFLRLPPRLPPAAMPTLPVWTLNPLGASPEMNCSLL